MHIIIKIEYSLFQKNLDFLFKLIFHKFDALARLGNQELANLF